MSTFRIFLLNVATLVVGALLSAALPALTVCLGLGAIALGVGIFTGRVRGATGRIVPGVLTALTGLMLAATAAGTGGGGSHVPSSTPAAGSTPTPTPTQPSNAGTVAVPPIADGRPPKVVENPGHGDAETRGRKSGTSKQRPRSETKADSADVQSGRRSDNVGPHDATSAPGIDEFPGKAAPGAGPNRGAASHEADQRAIEIGKRRVTATFFERQLRAKGMSVRISAIGVEATTLRVESPMCTRSFLSALHQSAGQSAKRDGFRTIECIADGPALSVDL